MTARDDPVQCRIDEVLREPQNFVTFEEYVAALTDRHGCEPRLAVLCELIEAVAEPEERGRTQALLKDLEAA